MRSLCVFCGSRLGQTPAHREAAARLGALLAQDKITLVYGGGRVGLMGVVADATLAGGGRVIGVIPDFLQEREVGHWKLDDLVITRSMHERKQRMFDLADGFVVLPGGLGTLDETIEIMTWKQLDRHAKPIVLVNVANHWRPLLTLIEAVIRTGFASERTRDLYTVVETVDDAIGAAARAPAGARGSSAGL